MDFPLLFKVLTVAGMFSGLFITLLISMHRNILNSFHVDFILTLVEPSFSSNNHHIIVFIRTLY
jgi:hypothetical protein